MSEENIEQVAQPEAPALETPAEVASGGSGNEFLEMIPVDLREHPSLSPIKDVENLARSYVNAQRLIGSDKIPMPVNPTDEDLDRIYGKLGRPESAEGYGIKSHGDIITEEAANNFADIAHSLRLNTQQAQGIMDYYKSSVEQAMASESGIIEEARETTENNLRQEWGRTYDQKVEAAAKTAQEFAAPEIFDLTLADGSKLGDNIEFIKAFAKIAEFRQTVTSEDTVAESSQSNVMTPANAEAEISSIMGDKTHAYWDRKNPQHHAAVDRMARLMEMQHG